MATYGRGRHIVPSIRSVLAQEDSDFELLIVGDGCDDDTEEAVKPFLSGRVRWFNLPEHSGSQSFPNNEGIANAAGRYIAYIGHDDIWAPGHLKALKDVFDGPDAPDFAVSGLCLHVSPGLDRAVVHGVFDTAAEARKYFFPPSSVAHRLDVPDRIGAWRNPYDVRPPVDLEIQLRAHAAGLSFASTGRITVHKFAAAHRYLSYLLPDVSEQEAMLEKLGAADYTAYAETLIAAARRDGTYMQETRTDFSGCAPGEIAREYAARKGNHLPPSQMLEKPLCLHRRQGRYAHDWHAFPEGGVLWKGLALAPKMLVPFSSKSGRAYVALTVLSREPLTQLPLAGTLTSAVELTAVGEENGLHATIAQFTLELDESGYTILTFERLPAAFQDEGSMGLGTWLIAPEPAANARDMAEMALREAALGHLKLVAMERTLARSARAESDLVKVYASTSWKITAPLRWVVTRLRGIFGAKD
ncbi:MAG: glycosyltransferase family 2 protein [Rhodobiaceae bacterium]|nr:glycosyltransferase family 2 protein [Rhodobiaceae bacterium]MCC0049689.1 glycosyltransferase family 2 protein [Rhodobiaceae bacterium]